MEQIAKTHLRNKAALASKEKCVTSTNQNTSNTTTHEKRTLPGDIPAHWMRRGKALLQNRIDGIITVSRESDVSFSDGWRKIRDRHQRGLRECQLEQLHKDLITGFNKTFNIRVMEESEQICSIHLDEYSITRSVPTWSTMLLHPRTMRQYTTSRPKWVDGHFIFVRHMARLPIRILALS
jgi:hypothetical protein